MKSATHTYEIPPAGSQETLDTCVDEIGDAAVCAKGGKVSCDERIEIVRFAAPAPVPAGDAATNFQRINRAIANLAARDSCTAEYSGVYLRPRQIYARGALVSIVFDRLVRARSANGSCHGELIGMTFDADLSGTPLQLADVVDAKDRHALQEVLLRELQSEEAAKFDGRDPVSRDKARDGVLREADAYLSQHGWRGGFFIEDGTVRMNIGEFLFSCADGNVHPVEVPDAYLKPDFAAKLRHARAQP